MDRRKKGKLGMVTRVASSFLCFIIVLNLIQPTIWANEIEEAPLRDTLLSLIEETINWKKKSIGIEADKPLFSHVFLENAGNTTGDWYPFGMGRIGYPDAYENYLAVLEEQVKKRYEREERLSESKATEWHRIALAILASGGDPRHVAGQIDLIEDGSYNRGKTRSLGSQGINGWIWGLITVDSMRYIIPEDAHDDRKSMITAIMEQQLSDGGFSLHRSTADPDMTAMAIQALAPYYNSEEIFTYRQKASRKEVKKKVRDVIDEALLCLSRLQRDEGDYASWETPNAESTAQVIVALTSLGIDPLSDERFIKKGKTLLDGILKYRMPDGGFIHSESYDPDNPSSLPDESNTMASEQVLYALVSLVRHYDGYRTLYDMREEMGEEVKRKIQVLEEKIDALPLDIDENDRSQVEESFHDYLSIPLAERSYVSNYVKLAKAMEELSIENTAEAMTEAMGVTEEGKGKRSPIFTGEEEHHSKLITEKDRLAAEELLKADSTEYLPTLLSIMKKIEEADNRKDYEALLGELSQKKHELEAIQDEIDWLNDTIIKHLYPFSEISIEDKELVEDILARYQALSPYDQKKIYSYEDVEKAEVEIRSLERARYIKILLGLVILLTVTIYFRYRRKKSRERQAEKNVSEE